MGILEDLKLDKGQPPMNAGQFQRRVLAFNENIWPQALREQYTDAFELWKDEMRPVLAEAEANYAFNHKLAAYKAARARLARYRLADGRPEITDMIDTGKINPDGSPYLESVVVQPAIEPLSATVETLNDTGQTVVSPNPAIVQDDAERAEAQAVIDATPADVVEFFEGL